MAEFADPNSSWWPPRRKHMKKDIERSDAYTPFPIEALSEAIGFHKNHLPLIVLIGGILGCIGGFALWYWVSVIDYPINVGGKPFHSWPSFIPVTFETTFYCGTYGSPWNAGI